MCCFIDGMQLIDFEEIFTVNMHETFKLDSFAMFPSSSWEAAIKKTRVGFELVTDINMLLFMSNSKINLSLCRRKS